ncbi:hypothetical protein INS49_014834 [Diaporthe citri]|uniref:uncharacterized protein n=1 Tax=Diaporthe citri TaxID=83186 RepID=UPI001C8195B7|nr:uncharacterized protein INS49_014834 [Diaporthe citri]KAG6356959.1 hypothetical protein INS49_014834 [Diaporthe citri]
MANQQGLDHLSRFVLQQTIDYFDNFWKTSKVWEPYERVSIFEKLPIPYWSPARPDPALDEDQQAAVTAARRRDLPFHRVTRSDAAGGDALEERMRVFFEESGYTFVKILGAGSQGVAALFEFAGQRVVIKWSQELAALATEMWAMRKMVGARHIVQVSESSVKTGFLVPKIEAGVAGAALPTDTGIIDFDMNDRNVMIGDLGADPGPGHPHDQVPVVKVGDLGVVTRLLPRHRDNFFVLVAGRLRGNMWYHFPEQFTETWKNMDGMESLAADEVAGKYGWTSNLWQVGRLMTIMIARVIPNVPPTCTQSEITKPDGTTQTIWTYSGHLLGEQFDHYDPLLRSTVAWCMAHRPADRPGILELERLITDAVAVDRSAAEAQGRVSIRELLGVPPATATQVPSAVQDPPAVPPAPAAAGTAGPPGTAAPGGSGGRGERGGGGRGAP